jgi:hypothetical protein
MNLLEPRKVREPIFAVRPSVAFGLEEEAVLQNATRWP